MRILATGATGFVGQRLVQTLLEAGCDVRALSRSRSKAVQVLDSGVEVVEGDVLESESLENLVVVTEDTAQELLDVERPPFDEAVACAVEHA